MEAVKLGTVWTARARLFNSAGRQIATCTDTPNAIAKAFMERPEATTVKESYSETAVLVYEYRNRMNMGNTCRSGLTAK